ncbi:MAG: hypothetical protein AAFR14_12530, partial [Bacteroidota bacterium]
MRNLISIAVVTMASMLIVSQLSGQEALPCQKESTVAQCKMVKPDCTGATAGVSLTSLFSQTLILASLPGLPIDALQAEAGSDCDPDDCLPKNCQPKNCKPANCKPTNCAPVACKPVCSSSRM